MTNVIGVRFRRAGKIYYFSPGEDSFRAGEHVIVETARGIEYGDVMRGNHEVPDELVVQPLKTVLRRASEEDTEHELDNREKEKEAFKICKERIVKHGLEMKLISCEFTFDNSKVLFYFTADGRVDFRDLVKDLASQFRTRIELRQVGVRDETKMLGGLGSCGRPLCCASYLNDFVPVSIKMAKEQNLSLNPVKISGVCGRLMCCLKNEEEVYEELNKKLPAVGDVVESKDGIRGEVHSVSILKQLVKVVVETGDEREIMEFKADDLHIRMKRREKNLRRQEELRDAELERLEKCEACDKCRKNDRHCHEQESVQADEAEAGSTGKKRHDRRNNKPARNNENASNNEQPSAGEAGYDNALADASLNSPAGSMDIETQGEESQQEGRNKRRRNRNGRKNHEHADGAATPENGNNGDKAASGQNESGSSNGKNRNRNGNKNRNHQGRANANQDGVNATNGENGAEGGNGRNGNHNHRRNRNHNRRPKQNESEN